MNTTWKPACSLTKDETAQAEAFSHTIDITDRKQILQYGSACEEMMQSFVDRHLLDLPDRTKAKAYAELDRFMQDAESFSRQFREEEDDFMNVFTDSYQKTVRSMKHAVSYLEMYRREIASHMNVLDEAETLCLKIIRTYDMYILAGLQCLETEQGRTFEGTAFEQNNGEENHQVEMDRLERRLSSLMVSQKIPEQTIASIHLIMKDENILDQSLDAMIDHVFPLWQNGVVLSIHPHREGDRTVYLDQDAFEEANETLVKSLKKLMK